MTITILFLILIAELVLNYQIYKNWTQPRIQHEQQKFTDVMEKWDILVKEKQKTILQDIKFRDD